MTKPCLRCGKTKPMKCRPAHALYCKACSKKVEAEKTRARGRKWYRGMKPAKKKRHLKTKKEKRSTPEAREKTKKYNADYYLKRKEEDPNFRNKRGSRERSPETGQARPDNTG